ncbi:transcriptional regulator [Paenibacillus mucilaginosus K02]|uniref:Transcriptional regulator n=1 Tax=Paenibacillus mucilaginosus K02 TaxID=997761 RepID=I0BCH8_9BACL|nr:transcriptional regulator [Paenibacillus mucilaginosus K02]
MESDQILELRAHIQKFVRQFGLLEGHVTPCGYPLSVSQVYALQELENRQMSVTELAGCLHLERSSVSRLADGLVKEGFVSRAVNEANRRETLLSLTDKGVRVLGQVREQSLQFFGRVFGSFSDEEHASVCAALAALNAALSRHQGKEGPYGT